MATPTVKWVEKDLEDMIPPIVKTIADGPLLGALGAYADFQRVRAIVNAAKFTPDSLGSLPAAVVALQALVSVIDGAIGDLINTGIHFLAVPSMQGGALAFGRRLNTALLNTSDLNRPVFSPTATIAAIGAFTFAPDNRVTELAFDSIKKGFISKPEVARALNVENFTERPGSPAPHFQNILLSTARPVVRSPWVNLTIAELVPPVAALLQQVKAITTAVLNTVKPSSIQSYLQFANRQVTTLQSIVNDINTLLSFINNSFDPLPLHVFAVQPVLSGTQALADAIVNDFFVPTKHPEIKDAVGSFYISGFMTVMGSDLTPASVEAKYSILSTIMT